jgi:molybdopterin converting factor small subunit
MKLTVEFLGLSRRLTQKKDSLVEIEDQATLRDVIRHLATQFPALVGPVIVPETYNLVSSYMINIDGRRAATDLDVKAQDGQILTLMFVEAGG